MGRTLEVSVNGSVVRVERHPILGWSRRHGVAIALAVLLIALIVPNVALADMLSGYADDMGHAAVDSIAGLFSGGDDTGGPVDLLTSPFDSLLGGHGGGTMMYDAIRGVHNGLKTLAASLLSFVMLMQLVKISQRMDSGSQMPAVKEVFTLVVMCAIWVYVINHSLAIVQALYDQVNAITSAALDQLGAKDKEAVTDIIAATGTLSIAGEQGAIAMLITWLILFLISSAGSILVNFMSLARGIQIYVEAAFAPIPLVLLGFDETRSWGVGYIKNFIAICLSGTIMLIILKCLPIMLVSVFKTEGFVLATDFGNVVVIELLAIICCFKSGAWARDILGG